MRGALVQLYSRNPCLVLFLFARERFGRLARPTRELGEARSRPRPPHLFPARLALYPAAGRPTKHARPRDDLQRECGRQLLHLDRRCTAAIRPQRCAGQVRQRVWEEGEHTRVPKVQRVRGPSLASSRARLQWDEADLGRIER